MLEKRKSLQRRFLIFCAWGIRRRRRTREALLCTAQQGSERHGGGGKDRRREACVGGNYNFMLALISHVCWKYAFLSRSNFVVTKTMNDDVGWTDDDDGTRERLPTYFSKTDFPRLKELAARITKDLTYLNLRYLHII